MDTNFNYFNFKKSYFVHHCDMMNGSKILHANPSHRSENCESRIVYAPLCNSVILLWQLSIQSVPDLVATFSIICFFLGMNTI